MAVADPGALKQKILVCFKDIIGNLTHVDSISDHLISTNDLANDDSERITTLKLESEKARKLINILLKKGEDALQHFMDALQEDGTQMHIYNQIQDSEVKNISQPQSETVAGIWT